MKTFELNYDENCLLIVEGHVEEDNFDHEFGVQRGNHFEITEFTVLVYIKGSEFDVTKAIPEGRLDVMKEWAQSEIETQLRE